MVLLSFKNVTTRKVNITHVAQNYGLHLHFY